MQIVISLLCLFWLTQAPRPAQKPDFGSDVRLSQVVQANIMAVHAYQILLARKAGKGDPVCYSQGSLSEPELQALVDHQASLLSSDRIAVRAWTRGQTSRFDPSRDLDPLLAAALRVPDTAPVNVFAAYLRQHTHAPQAHIRAVANLYQTALEIDRDGNVLQDEFDFYIALGLPVYVGSFDLPGSDEALLVAGKEIAARTCTSPFDTDAAAWQIAGRKVWNWAEKNLHIRDEKTIAAELAKEPETASLLSLIRALPPCRVAIIGHSFTMAAHWSSPSSFVPIVSYMVSRENPKFAFRQFEAGGLTASRAQSSFLKDALEWKPDKVLLVVLTRRDEDYAALGQMGRAFREAGAQCIVFDNLHDPESQNPDVLRRFQETARAAGMTILPVDRILSTASDRNEFVCLDNIHMKEPYHRLMAREWLRFLAGGTGTTEGSHRVP